MKPAFVQLSSWKFSAKRFQVGSFYPFFAIPASSADIAIDFNGSEQSCRNHIAGTVCVTDYCFHSVDFIAPALRAYFSILHVFNLLPFFKQHYTVTILQVQTINAEKQENFLKRVLPIYLFFFCYIMAFTVYSSLCQSTVNPSQDHRIETLIPWLCGTFQNQG